MTTTRPTGPKLSVRTVGCAECGALFETKAPRAKYCPDRPCAKTAFNRRRRVRAAAQAPAADQDAPTTPAHNLPGPAGRAGRLMECFLPTCSTVFTAPWANSRYCSPDCVRQAERNARQAEQDRKKLVTTCVWEPCGRTVRIDARSRRRFCSTACRYEATKARNRKNLQEVTVVCGDCNTPFTTTLLTKEYCTSACRARAARRRAKNAT